MACRKQEEQKILTICKEKLHKELVRDVFVLTYDRMRRYERGWHLERGLLFPEHIFLESENEKNLFKAFKKCGYIDRLEKCLIRINQEEEEFLKGLCGEEHHLKMSRGIICKGGTQITEGPLKGMEKRICRIDRHKRLARVELMKRESRYVSADIETSRKKSWNYHSIPAGLEIMEKII